jgi:type I restriction enzyme S subunit
MSVTWPTKKLGELADICRGSSPRPICDTKYFDGGTVPWVKIADATKSGKFLYKTKEHVNDYGASFSRRLPPGTILVAASGTLGYTQILGVEGCAHDGWLILQKLRELDRDFAYYALKTLEQHFFNSGSGAAIQNINTDILREAEIPYPPLPVQRRIAGILSAYDELIENSQRRIRLLEDMARALYREWFVHFRFPGHDGSSPSGRGKGEGAKPIPRLPSALGDIPQGWEVKTIGEICESVSYGYTASASRDEVGPKFLRITDIVPSTIDWAGVPFCEIPEDKGQKYLLKTGDIVVARTGATTGYAKRLNKLHPDTVFASYLVRARTKIGVSNLMLGILMESDEYKHFIQRNMGGAAQPQANAVVLTSMQLAVPPSPIGEHFDRLVGPMIDEGELLARKIQNLRRTRDLLLPRLLSGQVALDSSLNSTHDAA